MKIGLDFDGVIVDTAKLKSVWAKKLFGIDIEPYYFGTPYVVEKGLIEKDMYSDLLDYVYEKPEVYLSVEPVQHAIKSIHKLLKKNYTVRVVTAKTAKTDDLKREWLARRGLNIEVVGVGINESKADSLKGYDVFIDDSLIKLYEIINVVDNRFLFSHGYNEAYKSDGVATRIRKWGDFFKEMNKIEN